MLDLVCYKNEESEMAEWLFDKSGHTSVILDGDKLRNSHGSVIAWISGNSVYSLHGKHIGWFEGGVIFDSSNSALAFSRSRTGPLPNTPGLSGTPGMPGFSGVPGRPGFAGVPGRPGRGGWSNQDADIYLGT